MTMMDAIRERDEKSHELEREYNRRFDDLPVNSFGETSAEELLKLNEWYQNERDQINQIMIDKLNDER